MKKIISLFLAIVLIHPLVASAATSVEPLGARLFGYILLEVEKKGEAWYVYKDNSGFLLGNYGRYFLGKPADAFLMMKKFGLGIKHAELLKYLQSGFPKRLAGRFIIDVENKGEAYYIYPKDLMARFLGRPQDAFNVMRNLGLGVSDENFNKIPVAVETIVPVNDLSWYAIRISGNYIYYGSSRNIDADPVVLENTYNYAYVPDNELGIPDEPRALEIVGTISIAREKIKIIKLLDKKSNTVKGLIDSIEKSRSMGNNLLCPSCQ